MGYTTDINSRSRVMFTVLRDRLYEFETVDSLLERLMVLLMRNYAGIFVQDAYVDEGFLADQLDVTRKVLYDAFISLAKRKIIRYVPGNVKPYIVYYQPGCIVLYHNREGGLREPEGVVCHEDRGHGPLYPG